MMRLRCTRIVRLGFRLQCDRCCLFVFKLVHSFINSRRDCGGGQNNRCHCLLPPDRVADNCSSWFVLQAVCAFCVSCSSQIVPHAEIVFRVCHPMSGGTPNSIQKAIDFKQQQKICSCARKAFTSCLATRNLSMSIPCCKTLNTTHGCLFLYTRPGEYRTTSNGVILPRWFGGYCIKVQLHGSLSETAYKLSFKTCHQEIGDEATKTETARNFCQVPS